MILDLLPYKKPQRGRIRRLGVIRYLYFFLSLGLVLFIWYVLKDPVEPFSTDELYWLLFGNILFYGAGLFLAYRMKDNRAFCKYMCPVPVLQKITSRFSLLKMKIDPGLCVDCGRCEKVCPMDVKLLDYKNDNRRVLSTECILCSTCVYECPRNAVSISAGFDAGIKEKLNFR
jgi:polyferredoxin